MNPTIPDFAIRRWVVAINEADSGTHRDIFTLDSMLEMRQLGISYYEEGALD